MGMTMLQKIIARSAGRPSVSAGDVVPISVDSAGMLDSTFFPAQWSGRTIRHVAEPNRVLVIFDHEVLATTPAAADAHRLGREFVEKFGIERFHDIGGEQGISHVVIAENGYALPGTTMLSSDSHACSSGAFNCAAFAASPLELLFTVTTGQSWVRLGEAVRYKLTGRLQGHASAKDIFLHLAGAYGHHAGQYAEFGGEGMTSLSIEARRTLATMCAELGVDFALFEADDALTDYLAARTSENFEPQFPDVDAPYQVRRIVDLGQIRPMVALPDRMLSNTMPVQALERVDIQQAFIGSCANGNFEDLAAAARIVRGRKVAKGTRFVVTPGSQRVYRDALRAGHIETLLDAGAVFTSSTCGACMGGHTGVLGPGETCITASTRNFKGRMGHATARIYMASPETVAASAIAGRIVDPGEIEGAAI
jgi:3-isopropylmalate/(R)-2-methylmalate dehydratase large subunit